MVELYRLTVYQDEFIGNNKIEIIDKFNNKMYVSTTDKIEPKAQEEKI